MEVLMTGKGTSGSWKIRGMELGQTIGAAVIPNALDVAPYDLAVLVKRPTEALLERLHRANVRIIWDIVDSYPQPPGNEWSRSRCLHWLQENILMIIRPAGIVAATQAMAEDCKRFDVPVLALPHHARPGQRRNPIRPVKVIGYEGGEAYLGRWRDVIERQCAERGWTFVVNPAELADVDIVLALRDCGGYAPKHWKSGIKAMNAKGSGTPCILNREAGYLESATGGEEWADTVEELSAAFDKLTSQENRRIAAEKLFAGTFTLEAAASLYKEWLRFVVSNE